MKAGIAVILAALTALEASPLAGRVGYDVMINSDEETGSHASAALIAELAKGKTAALTYEPALPDGGLAGARPGSGNFSITVRGRSAHAGRNPEDGRNALVAAADLAVRLTMWTVAVRGIDEMYGMGLGAVGGKQGLRRALRLQAERLNKVVRRR